jgi:hypothetical protein
VSPNDFAADDRAVRDIIGFVLTFTVVVSAVGLTATVGYGQLTDFRQTQQLENVDRTVELAAGTLDGLAEGRSVAGTSELNLAGGSVTVPEPSSRELTVSVYDDSGALVCCNGGSPISIGALEVSYRNRVFAYESGALFRTSPQGHTGLSRAPPIRCRGGVATMVVTTIRPGGGTSPIQIGGSGTVAVTSRVATSEALYPTLEPGSSPYRIIVEVDSPSTEGWRQYFERRGEWTKTSPTTFECDSLDAVTVHRAVVDVTFAA